MLLKTLIKPKKDLVTVKEDITLEEALTVLEDSGYRCVPILMKLVRSSGEISIRCIFTATNLVEVI